MKQIKQFIDRCLIYFGYFKLLFKKIPHAQLFKLTLYSIAYLQNKINSLFLNDILLFLQLTYLNRNYSPKKKSSFINVLLLKSSFVEAHLT